MNDVDITILASEQIVVVETVKNVTEVEVPGPQGPTGPAGPAGAQGPPGSNAWSAITGKPTTVAGFGITDAATTSQLATKEPAIAPGTTSQYWRGDKTWQALASAVIASVLTGLSTATSTAVVATDTVLAGIGKLQAQINSLTTTVSGKEPTIAAGTTAQYWRGDKTFQTLNKAAVGLGNVDNTADVSKPISTAQQAALDLKVNLSSVGAANGVASLDSGGKVPSAQLPSYVDDVLEFANLAAFPATGETGKIYVALDTNFEYRWSGSTYIRLVSSPGTTDALTEGTTNLYFTAARVLASALAGLSTATNAVISTSDSVLSAFGKLQAQISGLASSKLDATATATAATKLATARNINGVAFDGTADVTIVDSTKEPAIAAGTTAQYWRGDKSWQDLATAVRAVVLTGLSTATNSAIVATDSVLVALGKLQAQLTALSTTVSGKQDNITGGATTITSANLTTSRALASDASGKVAVSVTTSTELGYVSGVTSAIQTQLNTKAPTASPTFTGTIDYGTLP